MKNRILIFILTIGVIPLFAQNSDQAKLDSLEKHLVGVWNFIEVADKEGNKIESIERETKNSPLGDKIKIKASGPNMTLNNDGIYELEFTPEKIDKGNWYLSTPDVLVFQHITEKGSGSFNMLKSAAQMFGKELKYDKDGNIVENNPRVIIKLESNIMWIEYEKDYFQIYKKKR